MDSATPTVTDAHAKSMEELRNWHRKAYPFNLRDRCVSTLEARYVGLRFTVCAPWLFGNLDDLAIHIRGSREALIRHGIVSAEKFSQIPQSGVTQKFSEEGIWRIAKLKDGWSVQPSECVDCRRLVRELRYCVSANVPGVEAWLEKRAASWHAAYDRFRAGGQSPLPPKSEGDFWSALSVDRGDQSPQPRSATILTHRKFDRAPVHQPHPRKRKGTIDFCLHLAQREYRKMTAPPLRCPE